MLLCWGEGHGSAIHDHADAHCFMKVLHGKLSEVRFEWPKETSSPELNGGRQELVASELTPMVEISRNTLNSNAVCYINGMYLIEIYFSVLQPVLIPLLKQ